MDIFADIVRDVDRRREKKLMKAALGDDSSSVRDSSGAARRMSKKEENMVIGLNQKKLVDHLRDTRITLTTDELHTMLESDEFLGDEYEDNVRRSLVDRLMVQLQQNPKVMYNRLGAQGKGTYSYKAKYDIRNIGDMRKLLIVEENRLSGLDRDELKDSYSGAEHDLEAMLRDGEIYIIPSKERKKGENVFYAEPQYRITLDTRLRDMWHGDMKQVVHDLIKRGHEELEEEMRRCGLKPLQTIEWATDAERKRKLLEEEAGEDGTKKRRRKNTRFKITNVHLGDQYDLTKAYNPELEAEREREEGEKRQREEMLRKIQEEQEREELEAQRQ